MTSLMTPLASAAPSGRRHALCATVAACGLLAACASPSDSVYFITKTSTSVVDADTVPSGISFGYDRVEGYAGPRFNDGTVFPVASSIESKGRGINREVRQAFATGNAALIVTSRQGAGSNSNSDSDSGNNSSLQGNAVGATASTSSGTPPAAVEKRKVVFFGTATSVGLKVGFDTSSPVPTSFTLGYKRKEVAVVPVDQHLQTTSVLGSFTNGVGVAVAAEAVASAATTAAPATTSTTATTATTASTATTGAATTDLVRFDVQQYFATGAAADNLAGLDSIKAQFQDKAKAAVGGIEKFRLQEARQGRLALDALACAQKLTGARFERLLSNADALGLFGPLGGVAAVRAATGEEAQRQKYVAFMSLLDADDVLAGERLALHKATVCEWAKAPA